MTVFFLEKLGSRADKWIDDLPWDLGLLMGGPKPSTYKLAETQLNRLHCQGLHWADSAAV